MAELKECQCMALNMLSRLSSLLNLWFDDMNRTEPGLGKLMAEMHNHLSSQLSLPEYSAIRQENKEILDSIDTAVADADVGKIKNISAIERIRDAIHRFPAIRQAFVCGPPLVEGKEIPLSKLAYDAMHILAEGDDPLEAKTLLDNIYKELTCTSQK